jgi:hypothetical protein
VGPDHKGRVPLLLDKAEERFFDLKEKKEREKCVAVLSDSTLIGVGLARRFSEANVKSETWSNKSFPGDFRVKLVSKVEVDEIFASDDGLDEKWIAFRAAFPDSVGYVVASKLVFSEDHSQAIMSIRHYFGPSAGSGGFVRFAKVGRLWWCHRVLDAPSSLQ